MSFCHSSLQSLIDERTTQQIPIKAKLELEKANLGFLLMTGWITFSLPGLFYLEMLKLEAGTSSLHCRACTYVLNPPPKREIPACRISVRGCVTKLATELFLSVNKVFFESNNNWWLHAFALAEIQMLFVIAFFWNVVLISHSSL